MEFNSTTSLTVILCVIIFFGLIVALFMFLINDNIKRLCYRSRHVDEQLEEIMIYIKIAIILQSNIDPSIILLKYEKNRYHGLEKIVKEEMEKNYRETKYDKFNISTANPFIGGNDS